MSSSRFLRLLTLLAVLCLVPLASAQDRAIAADIDTLKKELRSGRPNPTLVKKKTRELRSQIPSQLRKFGLNDATEEAASLDLSEADIDRLQAHYDMLA